eukprot:364779-Chlamydomonas_euryale.AAC.21
MPTCALIVSNARPLGTSSQGWRWSPLLLMQASTMWQLWLSHSDTRKAGITPCCMCGLVSLTGMPLATRMLCCLQRLGMRPLTAVTCTMQERWCSSACACAVDYSALPVMIQWQDPVARSPLDMCILLQLKVTGVTRYDKE